MAEVIVSSSAGGGHDPAAARPAPESTLQWLLGRFKAASSRKAFSPNHMNPLLLIRPRVSNAFTSLVQGELRPVPTIFLGEPKPELNRYARCVQASEDEVRHKKLPFPGQVVDELLVETDTNKTSTHPNEISGFAFALATIISLSLYRTNENDSRYNETICRLDLSPLYGSTKDQESLIRAKDGRGMLFPDTFFEDRVSFLPPAVPALLVLWNRNHNYIAHHLLVNNERNQWLDPAIRSSSDGNTWIAEQDDKIFDIARRINCAQFAKVVTEDFLKGLVGLSDVGEGAGLKIMSDPLLDPPKSGRAESQAYQATVEFNLLHNFYSTMSRSDIEWTERVMKETFHQTPLEEITPEDLVEELSNIEESTNLSRNRRSYAGLRRGVNDKFDDDALAAILHQVTESTACLQRARGTRHCSRVFELMKTKQARDWEVCSLNEFRVFLGLKAFKTFEEWNSDPDIVDAATRLYRTVDNLELYPGLQAEQSTLGAGFCLGSTMTYGLISEIVNTIRRDPRLTREFTPHVLTTWGYKDCASDEENGCYGAILPKLLLRNLPQYYPYNNVYGLFPLTVPSKTRNLLSNSASKGFYDFEKPAIRSIKMLETREAISHVFNNPQDYPTTYGQDLKFLTKDYGFFLGFDDEDIHDADLMMAMYSLLPDSSALDNHAAYFRKTVTSFAKQFSETKQQGHSVPDDGVVVHSVDVVRDIINATCIRWVCEAICGLPSGNDPKKLLEMFKTFADLYAFVFRHADPEFGWSIRSKAHEASNKLSKHLFRQLELACASSEESIPERVARIFQELTSGLAVETQPAQKVFARLGKANAKQRPNDEVKEDGAISNLLRFFTRPSPNPNIIRSIMNSQRAHEEQDNNKVVANVLGLSVVSSVVYAQACALAVDFYLDKRHSVELTKIIELSKRDDPSDNETIMGYIREAQRLGQPSGLFRDVKTGGTIPQGGGLPDVSVQPGDRLFANLKKAHMNPKDFPFPNEIQSNRQNYFLHGLGLHKCPGICIVDKTMPELFKAIFRLQNIRRANGEQGKLMTFFTHPYPHDSDPKVFLSSGKMTLFPESMIIEYDGPPQDKATGKWEVDPESKKSKHKKHIDWILMALAVLFMSWLFLRFPKVLDWWDGVSMPKFPSKAPAPTQAQPVICKAPTNPIHPWTMAAIVPGRDGKPVPVELKFKNRKTQQFSIVDIDTRDMQFDLFVDGVIKGRTPEFELDKTIQCGDEPRICLDKKFSAGVIPIPPGKHVVKIVWFGREYLPGSKDIDWGTERSRRFMWKLDQCS